MMEKPPSEGKVYYFASPYSHPCKHIKEKRYIDAIYYASLLTLDGYTLIEPIGMSAPVSQKFNLPDGYAFWKTRDRLFISRCDGIMVLMIDGVDESVGVQDEISYAAELGMPIYYIHPTSKGYRIEEERNV